MGTCAESEPQPQPDIIIVERNAMAAMQKDGKSFFRFGSDRVDFGDRPASTTNVFGRAFAFQSSPARGCNGAKGHCRHGSASDARGRRD